MKDPAVLIYIDTWISSTAEMDADCRGWYFNLTLHQYDKGGLPNDVEKLAQLAVVRFSEFNRFKQVWEQVLKQKYSICEDGRLRNEKASEIIRKREAFTKKRSKSGSIGVIVKLANELGFSETEKSMLKNDLFSDKVSIEEAKDKQMLKHLLKLYRNGVGDEDEEYKNNVEDGVETTADDDPKEDVREKTGMRPTLSEVVEYFMSNGYRQDVAERAFEYYEAGTSPSHAYWKDSRGNQVKNWKQKMRGVWFKDENKSIDDSAPIVPDGKKYVGIKEAYDIVRGNYSVLLQDRIKDGTDKEFVRKMMNNNPSFEIFGDGWVYNKR